MVADRCILLQPLVILCARPDAASDAGSLYPSLLYQQLIRQVTEHLLGQFIELHIVNDCGCQLATQS